MTKLPDVTSSLPDNMPAWRVAYRAGEPTRELLERLDAWQLEPHLGLILEGFFAEAYIKTMGH